MTFLIFKNKIKKENKILLKYFFLLASVFMVVFNWGHISWLFYPQVVRGVVADYVFKYSADSSALVATKISADILNDNNRQADECSLATSSYEGYCIADVKNNESALKKPLDAPALKESVFSISAIGIEAPIVFINSEQLYQYRAFMKKGVLHYPQSALPGEDGAIIILGHSAPPNWPKINYDWIFNDLNFLSAGDEIRIDFNGKTFIYQMREKYIINKGEELNPNLTNSKSVVVLISCWPAGKNQQRIIIEADLKN
jgi:LPXTG-site transpeptidase (sortase) family protein